MAGAATRYTYDFVRRSLPDGAHKILEIGCGNGELAAVLLEDRMTVVAIDNDAQCVAAARAVGVDARQATWPIAIDQKFDAVLFTRSLHHIHALNEAVQAAAGALNPGGVVIVEDFRSEGGSRRTMGWYSSLARMLDAVGAFGRDFDSGLAIANAEPSGHDLHSSTAIAESLRRAGPVECSDSAYCFRYLEAALALGSAKAVLDHELSLIEAGCIDALGQRFVLRPN